MRISRFEDIVAWQKARALTRDIYRFTRLEPVVRDFRFCAQIQSAAVSIMSNIAEGFERKVTRQFDQFLAISKGSCGEVRSLLYVGLDVGYCDDAMFRTMRDQTEEISRLIAGFRKSFAASKAITRNSELGTRNLGVNKRA